PERDALHEPLTGKVECLRRGLVLQLEALALSYPTLRIRARSSVSLPYLAMDQGPNQLLHRLSESLSSGSSGTNSYSNSSSGDGLVMGSGRGVCVDQHSVADTRSTLDEEYEDFQDNNETKSGDSNGVLKDVDVTQDDLDDNDDVYMETLDAVAFSTVIASCDKHGVLSKKTKGLLRNMKNYHCVAANCMLYLYLKETDERQRKTIDLTGYTARIATGEDIRDQRKRDSAFEIVGPGKKTHTFIARTARDRIEWLAALGRTIKAGRSRTLPSMSSLSGIFGNNITADMNTLILPPKASPPAPAVSKSNDTNKEDDFYYHDVAEDAKEEVYEVVGPEGTVFGKPVGTPETSPFQPAPNPSGDDSDLQDYDPVSPEDIPPPLPECPPPSTTSFGRRPPERPPLPVNVQDRINKQAARPLPDAPKDANYNSYDPGGIYCEIEEDFDETVDENPVELTSEYNNFSGDTSYVNRSNVSQDVKKPRAVSADGLPMDSGSMSPLSSRASTNSLVGSFSDEILMNMNLSDPNLTQPNLHKYMMRPSLCRTPPRLPPKGVPLPTVDDDDSEYKVPPSSIMDAEYQIPPSPIPTDVEPESTSHDSSGQVLAASEMYQVPPSPTAVPVKSSNNDKEKSEVEEKCKAVPSGVNEKSEIQPKSTLKNLSKQFDRKDFSLGRDFRNNKSSNQGTSVKDMIARLNKNKDTTEVNNTAKPKEIQSSPGNVAIGSRDQVDGDNATKSSSVSCPPEVKSAKPNLPPRPQNLFSKATLTPKNSLTAEEEKKLTTPAKATESDDDYYETPEGNSFDSTSQQDFNGVLNRDSLWKGKSEAALDSSPTAAGEWYVAKFAFVATTDQAISFNRGDLILVHETSTHSGWWKATVKGRTGVVPREYLKKKES
ncbi:LOW QUALITY PROTEIN: uncharacterized protein, partial [Palaemon carinicauda]|uniref:LOW QUALITY PROTEIN: uncharacterized protein n=1 Tax=Palaemon carinicauda TaxID=392227 RepID=UPI0035B6506A